MRDIENTDDAYNVERAMNGNTAKTGGMRVHSTKYTADELSSIASLSNLNRHQRRAISKTKIT